MNQMKIEKKEEKNDPKLKSNQVHVQQMIWNIRRAC